MAQVVLTGDKELNRKLRNLQSKLAKKITRQAARKALKPVLSAARDNAPRRTGALRRSIKIRAMKRSRTRIGSMVTTGEAGGSHFTGKQFYGAFLEFGWKTGKRRTEGRRQVPGRHFMKRAADDKRGEALRIYKAELASGIRDAVT